MRNLLLVCSLVGSFGLTSDTSTRTFGQPILRCKISAPEVNESSGIAPSRTQKDVYYTHNDSGDTARFFRFSTDGKVTGTFDVRNAEAIDWEDMASAKLHGKPYLFLGDIGDNRSKRGSVSVYRVVEPKASEGSGSVSCDRTYVLKYPNGAHNAETLLVHPVSGDIYIVTKEPEKPSEVFVLPGDKPSGEYTLTRLGEIKISGANKYARLLTGGAFSPDGKYVILRTYLAGYEFAVGRDVRNWWKSSPTPVKLMLDPQGEGITYSSDGTAILTSSEMSPCQICEVPIKQ